MSQKPYRGELKSPFEFRPLRNLEIIEAAAETGTVRYAAAPFSDAPQVGQRYIGWGKTWEVAMVWEHAGVAEIVNASNPLNTMRLPFTQFRAFERAADDD